MGRSRRKPSRPRPPFPPGPINNQPEFARPRIGNHGGLIPAIRRDGGGNLAILPGIGDIRGGLTDLEAETAVIVNVQPDPVMPVLGEHGFVIGGPTGPAKGAMERPAVTVLEGLETLDPDRALAFLARVSVR